MALKFDELEKLIDAFGSSFPIFTATVNKVENKWIVDIFVHK